MKRFLIIALAATSVGFITVGQASAAATPNAATYVANDMANGIGDSRHNLGNLSSHIASMPNTSLDGINGTSEICVFCHTPHHSKTAGLANVPIWNRNNPNSGTYTAYGSTLGGGPVGAPGATTLACLSCHDGVTTFDNIANRPGKGTGTLAGATFWDVDQLSATPNAGGLIASVMPAGRLNIGTALSNDHPVSVAYPSIAPGATGIASLRSAGTTISAINILAGLADSAGTFDGGNLTKNLWAVKGYINAGAKIEDLLRDNKVECSSCHDPHFNNKSYNEVDATYAGAQVGVNTWQESNGLFLRRVGGNSGSGVCRTCHNK